MKTVILLLYLLGSAQSLPMQLKPALGLPPMQLVPDQTTLLNQQQPNQVFPSLSLIPLTQLLTMGSDLQLLNPPPARMAPAAHALPLTLGGLNVQQQLQPQMLPLIVAQLGAQGTILSSEELSVAPQILGLIFHPLFSGAILPTNHANADVQNTILSAGQAGVNPAIQGAPEGPSPTPSGTDDDFEGTTPAGIQRGLHIPEETTTGFPNGIQ
ncbi:amelotin isoform X1 [Pipistrellus kuhlii]|uniref:Amelotin n=1 Tax=Pipistrellus kuhlii TaxID=59472 RepID=A0A7J8AY48_PIPKU|nr:amelotin isoform X1 [Pipistrellus kuhlii]KAF6391211.1 amelotin [Pipistrellus kuhlii]